jgi:hypothetical protein
LQDRLTQHSLVSILTRSLIEGAINVRTVEIYVGA